MVDALDRNMGVHMNFQFPASPTEGQIYAPAGGPQYVYRAPYWRASGRVDTIVAETPPAGPKNGQLWFNSSTGNTYIWYEDPNSAQWVQINVGPDASSSVLTPERFGADPTGVASSDAAFDALAAHVNSIGGNCTIEMAGRYKLVATHTFTVGNVLVDGRGTGLIDVSASTDTSDLMPIMHFTGPGLSRRRPCCPARSPRAPERLLSPMVRRSHRVAGATSLRPANISTGSARPAVFMPPTRVS